MSINGDYLGLIETLANGLPAIDAVGLRLPEPVDDGRYRDEFGFVFLDDGSVGPFYVSLDTVLATLWERYPRPDALRFDPVATARRLAGGDLAERALALGAYNALSRRLMRRAGYRPAERGSAKELAAAPAGEPVGMVGYFCPVIDRLVAAGNEVLVLEQQPARVPERAGVRVTTRPVDLAVCGLVLCTASVLINDTLDEVLRACTGVRSFQLIGPSGSGLPDALFAHGVHAVGGIAFEDPDLLKQTLDRGEPWGTAGCKYQIERDAYPGVGNLLAACR
jgi:hypothetical protein